MSFLRIFSINTSSIPYPNKSGYLTLTLRLRTELPLTLESENTGKLRKTRGRKEIAESLVDHLLRVVNLERENGKTEHQ